MLLLRRRIQKNFIEILSKKFAKIDIKIQKKDILGSEISHSFRMIKYRLGNRYKKYYNINMKENASVTDTLR